MGASKRIAEFLTAQAASRTPDTCAYVSVRFGNVLGSNGSVIPIFKEQIKNGGPVTVTHPEMTRYFMSVPEAVQLVLQAGSIAENGATYILDMGEQVKIMDLATDLIRLSGFEPQVDIHIAISGKRPGEKLYEELQYEEEEVHRSEHQKILVVKAQEAPDRFDEKLDALLVAAQRCDLDQIQHCLLRLIPSYECQDEMEYQF
jgi:FlaA1/EpsC-like NDP-sugar epimerase